MYILAVAKQENKTELQVFTSTDWDPSMILGLYPAKQCLDLYCILTLSSQIGQGTVSKGE